MFYTTWKEVYHLNLETQVDHGQKGNKPNQKVTKLLLSIIGTTRPLATATLPDQTSRISRNNRVYGRGSEMAINQKYVSRNSVNTCLNSI